MSVKPEQAKDPRFIAAVDQIGRTGCKQFQIRYSDDEQPVIWMAAAVYDDTATRFECAAAPTPLLAVQRLLDQLLDGGECRNCGKPTTVLHGEQGDDHVRARVQEMMNVTACFRTYNPETEKYERSCE